MEMIMELSNRQLDWLRARIGKLTSSDCHKLFIGSRDKKEIFGVVAKKYLNSKVAEIMTQDIKEQPDFKQMIWGKEHEPFAVPLFESFIHCTGTHYGVENPTFFEYGDHAGGSPDWECMKGKKKIGAEIKCPFDSGEHIKNLLLADADELKSERWEYYCQMQFNMMIREWNQCFFASYDPRMIEPMFQLIVIPVEVDHEWRKEFTPRLELAINELQLIAAEMQKKHTIRQTMFKSKKIAAAA